MVKVKPKSEKTRSTTYRIKRQVLDEFTQIAEDSRVTTSWLLETICRYFLFILGITYPTGIMGLGVLAREFIDFIKIKIDPTRAKVGSDDVKVILSVTLTEKTIDEIVKYAGTADISPSNLVQNFMQIYIDEYKKHNGFGLVSMAMAVDRLRQIDTPTALGEWLKALKSQK